MNLMLNMKDINKILAKAHFKCNCFFKWCGETTHFCGNMSLWSCWKSSLLPPVLWGRSQVSLSCFHFSLMFSEGEVKSPCHVFTFPSCSLREKSSLPVMFSLLPHVLWGRSQVSLSCLHFSLMFSEGEVKSPCHVFTSPSCSLRKKEVKSPCFLQVGWALLLNFLV